MDNNRCICSSCYRWIQDYGSRLNIDGDGKITTEEVAMKERMLEVELREEKAESQKKMAWIAMVMMIGSQLFYLHL